MSSDVVINKNYPAVEYEATETGAIYFEDREVDGVMYRTQNAQFGGTTWSLYNSALPAFAIAQKSNGSVRFLSASAGSSAFSTWPTGSPNDLAWFNVMDYGATGNGTTNDTASINAAIAAAVAAGGGVVYYPAGTYAVSSIVGVTGKESVSVFHVGAGRDATIVLGSFTASDGVVFALNSQGGVFGMTFNGDGNVVTPLGIGNTDINSTTLSASFTPPAVGSSGTFSVASASNFAIGQQVQVGSAAQTTLGTSSPFSPPGVGSSGTFSVVNAANIAVGQAIQVGNNTGELTAYVGTVTSVSSPNITATTTIQGNQSSWPSYSPVQIPAYVGSITNVSGTSITATTLVQGNSSASWASGSFVQSGNPIEFVAIRDVRCTNIGNGGTWLFATDCTPGAAKLIATLWLDKVSIEGPSSSAQDAMGIGCVDHCFVNAMEFKNLGRTPNFYFMNYLTATNIRVTGGQNNSSEPCFVVDGAVEHAVLSGLAIDSSNQTGPMFESPDCTVANSNIQTTYCLVGQPAADITNIGMRFVGCVIASEVVIQGANDNSLNWLEIIGCRIVPPSGGLEACILNNQPSTTPLINNYSVRNCVLDTTNATYAFASKYTATMSYSQLIGNVVRGTAGLFGNVNLGPTIGTGNVVRGNAVADPPVFNTSISPTASPYTYTNDTGYDGIIYVIGGSGVMIKIAGTAVTPTSGGFQLLANQSITISYTSVPTVALVSQGT